jgi:hypothetical protein
MILSTWMRKVTCAILIAGAGLAPHLGAQAVWTGDPWRFGIIFNMSNPLQGLQSYEGGFGAKFLFGRHAVRGLLETSYNSASGALALDFGGVYEYHFLQGPVSPYDGGSLEGGYLQQGTASSVVPLSIGALIGAEIYVTDFISLFVEYSLSFGYTSITDLQQATSTSNFSITTGMGNNAMIGVVVYLPPPKKRP